MSTKEKLLVEIFQRKNSIIEQAKQQIDLHIQNITSKLVIDGIPPPSWAWSGNESADSKELNKEELISRLLHQQAQPTGRCSRVYYPSYSNPLGTGDNVEISDGFFMDPLAFKKALNRKDHPTVSTISKGDVGCTFNNLSEMDVSITSPEDQKDERAADIYIASDKSPSRFQRSKSRQKALQLRSSSKSLNKGGLSHENINDNFRLSIASTKQVGGELDILVSTEDCAVAEGCMEQGCGKIDSEIKEKDTGVCTGSVTRCRSCAKGPDFVEGSKGLGCMSSSYGNDVSLSSAKVGTKRSVSNCYTDQANYINKLQKSGPSPVSFRHGIQSYGGEDHPDGDTENGITKNNKRSGFPCGRVSDSLEAACSSDYAHRVVARDNVPAHYAHELVASYSEINVSDEIVDAHQSIAQDCQTEKEKGMVPYIGTAGSWSLSQPNACADNGPHHEDISSHSNQTDSCHLPTSGGTLAPHVNTSNEEPELVESSFGTDHIVTRPLSWANQDILNPASHPTSKLEKKYDASDDDLNASCGQSVPPFYAVHHNDQQDANTVVGTEHVLCKVDQSVSTGPTDNKQSGVLESLVGRSIANSLFVEPKELNVNMSEDYSMKTSISRSSKKQGEMSEQMDFSDPGAPVDREISGCINQPSTAEESVQWLGVLSKGKEGRIDSSIFNVQENLEASAEKYAGAEPVSCEVGQSVSGFPTHNKQTGELESLVTRSPVNSSEFVKYEELGANMAEEYNLSSSTNKEKTNMPEQMDCSSDPAVSVDTGIRGNLNQLSTAEQTVPVDVRGDKTEVGINSSNFIVQEILEASTEKYAATVGELNMPKLSQNNAEVSINCEISEVRDEINVKQSADEPPHLHNHPMKLHIDLRPNSLPLKHNEEGNLQGEEKDEVSPVSNALRSNTCKLSYSANLIHKPSADSQDNLFEKEESGIPACDIHSAVKKIHTEDNQALPCLDFDISGQKEDSPVRESGLMIANSDGSAVLKSWPQLKKRKIEHQEANRHTTSPCFRMKKLQIIEGGPSSTYLMNVEKDLDFPDAFRVTRNTDMEMNQLVDVNLTELESTSEYQNGGGNCKGEEKDEVSPFSNALRSNTCKRSNSANLIHKPSADSQDNFSEEEERGIPACDILGEVKPIHTLTYQALPCLDFDISGKQADSPVGESGSLISNSDGSAVLKSWPQLKKRKIDHQEANRHSTSPCFRMKKLQIIEGGPSNTYLMNLEKDLNFPGAFRVTRNTDMEMNQLVDVNVTELESTSEYQNGGGMEQNKDQSSPSIIEQSVDSLAQKKAGKSEDLYVEGIRNYPSIVRLDSGDLDKNILGNTDYENSVVDRMDESSVSSQWKDGLHSQCSVVSPNNPVDQPVFEGFRVDGQSDSGELECPLEEVDFDLLNFPRTTIERASTLANLCEFASMDRPLSEFKEIQNLSRSVPNNLLKSLGMMSDLPLKGDVDKQLVFGSSGLDNVNDSSEQIPISDCLSRYDALYCWNSGNLLASPVGRFSERLSMEKRSSEKCSSTNSDLTCFRIEEDPCISEGSGTMDDAADDVQDGIDSPLCNSCDKRKPLGEMTNLGLVPPVSDYMQDDICRESSAVSVTASQYKFQRSTIEKPTSSLGKQTFSVGANGIRKTKKSVNRSVNRSGLRSKSNLKTQEKKLSLKESRQKNIVSNMTSFLPLVQQKAAATICAGKRDVKVKALEIAEAAKRLEERRENERKMKREALKLERVKLEEKNLREKELEKKRKEDERKKKDADNILKKRLREEEEMREKEKKKMRIEARQRQRGQEEISHAKKAEKDNDHSKGEKVNSKKERNGSKKPQNKETMRGDNAVLKKTESKWVPAEFLRDHEVLATSCDVLEAEKATHTMDKSPASALLMFQKSQGKSYEISPYQCSDDDEDEEGLSPKKFIPSWASKSSVVVRLAMQQELKIDEVFPPGSFCSVDKVLLPRSVRQKTHA